MSVSMLAEVSLKVRPPRVLVVPFPLGCPLGMPDDAPLQRAVLHQMLDMLVDTPLSEPLFKSFVQG